MNEYIRKIKNINRNKKMLIIFVVFIIVTLLTSSLLIFTTSNDELPANDAINIQQSEDDVTVTINHNEPFHVEIQEPDGEIGYVLSQPGESITINKYLTDTKYGEYRIIDADENVIGKFIIDEPTGENIVNVHVVDENDQNVSNANVTIGEITRQTSDEGIVQFYNVGTGYKIFNVEAENYENYRTNFKIIKDEMDIKVTINNL